MTKIKHEPVTRGIKHWGLGGYSIILPRIKFGVTGQVSNPQSPTVSYVCQEVVQRHKTVLHALIEMMEPTHQCRLAGEGIKPPKGALVKS